MISNQLFHKPFLFIASYHFDLLSPHPLFLTPPHYKVQCILNLDKKVIHTCSSLLPCRWPHLLQSTPYPFAPSRSASSLPFPHSPSLSSLSPPYALVRDQWCRWVNSLSNWNISYVRLLEEGRSIRPSIHLPLSTRHWFTRTITIWTSYTWPSFTRPEAIRNLSTRPSSTRSNHLRGPIIYSDHVSTRSSHLLSLLNYSVHSSTPSTRLLGLLISLLHSSTCSTHLLRPLIYTVFSST